MNREGPVQKVQIHLGHCYSYTGIRVPFLCCAFECNRLYKAKINLSHNYKQHSQIIERVEVSWQSQPVTIMSGWSIYLTTLFPGKAQSSKWSGQKKKVSKNRCVRVAFCFYFYFPVGYGGGFTEVSKMQV